MVWICPPVLRSPPEYDYYSCLDPLDEKRKCECTTYMIIAFASPEQHHSPYSRDAFGRLGFGKGTSFVFQFSGRQGVCRATPFKNNPSQELSV
jgi:hypothetical protein